MSLITTKQASQANGTSGQDPQEWARQAAEYLRARQLAAQAQLAPLAANTRVATQQGVYGARAWTAPRLELMAQALQEQWAPKMAAALAAYARRVDPVPVKPPTAPLAGGRGRSRPDRGRHRGGCGHHEPA